MGSLRRSIKIKNKSLPHGSKECFFIMKNSICENAANELTHTGFLLFLYIYMRGGEGYEFGLSRTHFINVFTCDVASYKKAFHELVDKGYLIENEQGCYDFSAKGNDK